MSAFIVGHDHIDALLSFATERYTYGNVSYWANNARIEITAENATEVGCILLQENERSIRERYGSTDNMLDGAETYTFQPWRGQLTAVSILKACDCVDYQACETDDYDQSIAWKIINAIRKRAIGRLPDYSDAPGWVFRRPARDEAKPHIVGPTTRRPGAYRKPRQIFGTR